ncbi:MAG: Asp-tRNA(Asn)/Glu-tRNA(Gln) amidotransferase subunit GatC [Patescibacteria group bacterium]|nr:Asp-tRNA(Asn)/Glu-tRNA(Gln) amidotransferase subunit GatC [Patescibacteria group bacterium]
MSDKQTLPEKEVEWVARLAYISLTPDETKNYADDLSRVLDYIGELQKVDTSQTEETRQITGLKDIMAKDKVEPTVIDRETYLEQAPMQEQGFIKVKSVFNRE